MKYTDKELKLIKAREFDKGWGYGLLVGSLTIAIAICVVYINI